MICTQDRLQIIKNLQNPTGGEVVIIHFQRNYVKETIFISCEKYVKTKVSKKSLEGQHVARTFVWWRRNRKRMG